MGWQGRIARRASQRRVGYSRWNLGASFHIYSLIIVNNEHSKGRKGGRVRDRRLMRGILTLTQVLRCSLYVIVFFRRLSLPFLARGWPLLGLVESNKVRVNKIVLVSSREEMPLQKIVYWPERVIIIEARMQFSGLIQGSEMTWGVGTNTLRCIL